MASTLDWNDLRYFLAVARGGGLTAAATALSTSASTVSRHIDAMEERLGMRLFLRQQRGYLLTDQGSTLLGRVAEVERAMLAVERNGDEAGVAQGLVRLATPESLANHLVAPALASLACRHPRLQVELVVSRHMADLSRREADLALRIADPARPPPDPDYIGHALGRLDFGLYCTAPALARAGDWQRLDYIGWDDSWVRLPLAGWLAQLFPGREPVLRTNSMEAQYAAARAGLGALLLPCFIGAADPTLLRLPTPGLHPERELWLLYHRDLKGSRRVLAMRDFLQELVQQRLR